MGQGDTLKFWQVGSSLDVVGGSSPISAQAWDSSQVVSTRFLRISGIHPPFNFAGSFADLLL